MASLQLQTPDNPKGKFISFIQDRPGLDRVKRETEKAISCYYGGDSLLPYIYKYSSLEDQDKFHWRQQKIIENFENYAQEIAQQYVEGITRAGSITRKTDNAQLDEQIVNHYSEWFEQELMPLAILLPEVFVQICKPVAKKDIISKKDEIDQNLIPYPVIIFPQLIKNFSIDRDKKIQWISVKIDENIFEIWDNLNILVVNANGEIIGSPTPHGFTDCPFVQVIWRENKAIEGQPKPGHAFMFNVVMKTLAGLSWISMLQESAIFHLYPKLVWDEDTKKSVQKQGGMGADTPITEPSGPDVGGKTRYLSMPGTEMEILERILYERIPASIYRTARLRDRSTDKQTSGISKMMDMIPEVSVLTDITKFISRFDKAILIKIADNWIQNFKEENVVVTYPKTFDVKSTAEIMKQVVEYVAATDESSLPQSPTATKLLAERVTIATLSDLMDVSAEQQKTIQSEIQTADVKKLEPTIAALPAEPPLISRRAAVSQ